MSESATNPPQSAFAVFEEAFARAAGTPLVTGNEVRLLRDAGENYPAWLEAIATARQTIHFESYIIHDDETGQEFARALKARASAGVRVRVIYDWLGAVGKTSRGFWRDLREGGIEVRCFNPPACRARSPGSPGTTGRCWRWTGAWPSSPGSAWAAPGSAIRPVG